MASSVIPLRRPVSPVAPDTLGTFDRVRELVDGLAPENGHVGILDYADKLTVEALAKRSAMSPSHFAHRFSAVARVTPMRYLREVRLERARALLLAEGARMGEIAESVGFESSAHFAREFRRRFGLAPSRFGRAR